MSAGTTPNDTAKLDRPAQNTDCELWREPHPDPPGEYYANSIHVTAQGGIGINVGGTVVVKTLAQWHALVLEPDGQLRANLSNAAVNELLDSIKRAQAERDQAREQLTRAYSWIPESGMGPCPLCNSPDSDSVPRCKMCQHRKQAREQRDALEAALVEAAGSLDELGDGACHSKYGPGCDCQCKSVAYHAWTKAQSALSAIKAAQENSKP